MAARARGRTSLGGGGEGVNSSSSSSKSRTATPTRLDFSPVRLKEEGAMASEEEDPDEIDIYSKSPTGKAEDR